MTDGYPRNVKLIFYFSLMFGLFYLIEKIVNPITTYQKFPSPSLFTEALSFCVEQRAHKGIKECLFAPANKQFSFGL